MGKGCLTEILTHKDQSHDLHTEKALHKTLRLKLDGVELKYCHQVLYLGLWVDHKLTWKYHLAEKIKACKKILMAFVSVTGKRWGMSPWSARDYYNTMVKTSFCYLSMIWHHVCRLGTVQKQLKSLQRLAMKVMGPIWRGTPTRGLEVLCNIRPLELEMRRLAAESYIRTKPFHIIDSPKMKTPIESRKGHRQSCEEYLQIIG